MPGGTVSREEVWNSARDASRSSVSIRRCHWCRCSVCVHMMGPGTMTPLAVLRGFAWPCTRSSGFVQLCALGVWYLALVPGRGAVESLYAG